MTLILNEDDVESLLDIDTCLAVLEPTFVDLGRGEAVSRPRTHTYTYLRDATYYNFKSMDGAVPRYGVHALRLSSEVVQDTEVLGSRREEKLALAQDGRFVGLVMLFDLETTEPLAIIHDSGLQRLRVGATSALAAKYLSRDDSRRVGLFGTGWQAGPQLEALVRVRDIEEIVVFSLNPDRRRKFVATMASRLDAKVIAAEAPRDVVDGADIVVCATNSLHPVFDGSWLVAGQHVNSLQSGELDDATHQRADVIAVRAREASRSYYQAAAPQRSGLSQRWQEHSERWNDKVVTLGGVMVGTEQGRARDDQITLFGGSGTGPSSGLGRC